MLYEKEYTLDNISDVARDIIQMMKAPNDTLALIGDLGAGKTTLVSHIATALGVEDEVSSPTFSIINEYLVSNHSCYNKILHSDWYRIDDENEAIESGIEDMLEEQAALKLIEWPTRAEGLLPKHTLLATITNIGELARKISITSYFK